MNWDTWMDMVDSHMKQAVGRGVDDVGFDWSAAFDDGISPELAVERALDEVADEHG